jgi:hypothetical protein
MGSGLGRRDFMRTAASGAAVLCGASACPAAVEPPVFERAIVGQDAERGHLLRTGELRSKPVSERVRTSILIVGGGVAGAAAAWRLARAGFSDWRLLEVESGLGGTARGGAMPRSPYPMGAHYLPSPHPELTSLELLLQDLGVLTGRDENGRAEYDPRTICGAPMERHLRSGVWHEGLYPAAGETAEEADQWRRFVALLRGLDERRGRDGKRLFTFPVTESSAELRHLDEISMATYLGRLGLTSPRLRWSVDYACRDDYGCTLEQTSAFACLHRYLARGLEDTRDGFILTWPEGNAWLIRHMFERAEPADRVHRDTMVHAVDPDAGRTLAHDFAAQRNLAFESDVVLWAAPRFVLTHVLPPGADPLPRNGLTYVPWLVANVEVRRRPRGIGTPLSWDNVQVDVDNLGYVVASHTEPLTQQTEKGTVLTYYQPLCAKDDVELVARRTALLKGPLDHWCEHVVGELEKMHPGIRPDISRIHLTKWGHAMVRPTPGLLFGEMLATARRPIGTVLPCATDITGLPLFEEAYIAGVAAAETALARVGRERRSIL